MDELDLSGVMLGSEDSARLAALYTKVLGAPGYEQDGWYGYRIGRGNLMIGPHSEVHGQSAEPARVMLSLVTPDVAAAFAAWRDAGAGVVAEPYQPSPDEAPDMWLATLTDPDGNYVQLGTPWEDDVT